MLAAPVGSLAKVITLSSCYDAKLKTTYYLAVSYRTPFSVSSLVKLSVICFPPYGSLVVPDSIIHPALSYNILRFSNI